MRATVAQVVAAVALVGLTPSAVFAAHNSGGSGQHTSGGGGSTCSVSPSAVTAGGSFVVNASGLPVNHMLNLNEVYPSRVRTLILSTATGNASVTDTALADGGGSFTVKVVINDVNGRKPVTVSSCSFQVA